MFSFSNGLKNYPESGQAANPFYFKETLEANTKYLQSSKGISTEVGLDNYYNYIQQILDYGDNIFYTRAGVLTERGFAIIQKIVESDPQVIASIERLKLSVLQLGYTIKAKDDSKEAQELKEFIEYCLAEMADDIQDVLYALASCAIIYGYGLSEKNYIRASSGIYEGKIILKDIKNKKAGVYQFDTDYYGNLVSITNLYDIGNPLPIGKFIHYTWKKRYSNPYGGESALCEALYYLCWAKKQEMKNLLRGNAKFSNPTVMVEVPASPSDADIDAALTFVNDVQNTSGAILPQPLKASLLEVQNRGKNQSIESIEFLDSQIARLINLTDSTTTSSKHGTYGAKMVEQSSSHINEKYLKQSFQELVKEQIIRPLCEINYPADKYPVNIYPYLEFNPESQEDKNSIIERYKKLQEMGYINSNNQADRDKVRGVDGFADESDDNQTTEMYDLGISSTAITNMPIGVGKMSIGRTFPNVSKITKEYALDIKTNFPIVGDNKNIDLANSNYPQFDYNFAKYIKTEYPNLWFRSGNIKGNKAFELWTKAKEGINSQDVLLWIKERELWAERNYNNSDLNSVIDCIKWGVIVSFGQDYMINLLKSEIEK